MTDALTGEVFGIVATSPPELATISSPHNIVVSSTITATAQALQGEINRLLGLGIDKIVYAGIFNTDLAIA